MGSPCNNEKESPCTLGSPQGALPGRHDKGPQIQEDPQGCEMKDHPNFLLGMAIWMCLDRHPEWSVFDVLDFVMTREHGVDWKVHAHLHTNVHVYEAMKAYLQDKDKEQDEHRGHQSIQLPGLSES